MRRMLVRRWARAAMLLTATSLAVAGPATSAQIAP